MERIFEDNPVKHSYQFLYNKLETMQAASSHGFEPETLADDEVLFKVYVQRRLVIQDINLASDGEVEEEGQQLVWRRFDIKDIRMVRHKLYSKEEVAKALNPMLRECCFPRCMCGSFVQDFAASVRAFASSLSTGKFFATFGVLLRTMHYWRIASVPTLFVPTTLSAIEELPVVDVLDVSGFKEDECSICLQEYIVRDKVARLPCSHVFHKDCVTQWLKTSHLCPNCRFQMPH